MKRIGITGGIGMGKTTCAGLIRELGIPIIDTDDLARELVQPGQPALEEIRAVFGGTVLQPDGELNRAALAAVVFEDAAARQQLETILHPRIQQAWQGRVAALAAGGAPVAVVVIPLLYETGAETLLDSVVCVACSDAEQAIRLAARGWTPEQARARQAAQLPVVEKIRRADFVVWSEGAMEAHRQQVEGVLARLRTAA